MTTEYESEYQLPDDNVEHGADKPHEEDAVARFERQRASLNSGARSKKSGNHVRSSVNRDQELDFEDQQLKRASPYSLIAIIVGVVCIAGGVLWFMAHQQPSSDSQPQEATAQNTGTVAGASTQNDTGEIASFVEDAAQTDSAAKPNDEFVTNASLDPDASIDESGGLAPLGSELNTEPAQTTDVVRVDEPTHQDESVALLEKERDFTRILTLNIDKLQAENNELKTVLEEQKQQNKKLQLELEVLKKGKPAEKQAVAQANGRPLPNLSVATVVKSENNIIAMLQRNNGEAFTAIVGQSVATDAGKQIVKIIDVDNKRVTFESGMYVDSTAQNTQKELTQNNRGAKLQSSAPKPMTQLYEVSGWTWISQAKAADGTRTVIVMPPNGQPIRAVVNTDLSSYGAGVVAEINARGDVVFRNGAMIKNPFHN